MTARGKCVNALMVLVKNSGWNKNSPMFKVWSQSAGKSGRNQSMGLVAVNHELCGISSRLPTYSRNCPDDWVIGYIAFVNDRLLPLVLRGVAKASFKRVGFNR
jgi:hypothetical protein